MRTNKKLSKEECVNLLINETRGVLSVIGDMGYPYGMPMNHFYNSDDGCVYFHCGKKGHRIDSLKKEPKASFCVYDSGYKDPGEWSLNVKSVIIFGKLEIIEDIDTIINVSTDLSHKFTSDDEYINKEIEIHAKHTIILKLTPEHMCGKIVNES